MCADDDDEDDDDDDEDDEDDEDDDEDDSGCWVQRRNNILLSHPRGFTP